MGRGVELFQPLGDSAIKQCEVAQASVCLSGSGRGRKVPLQTGDSEAIPNVLNVGQRGSCGPQDGKSLWRKGIPALLPSL